ncbi:hypothetical protein ACG7TL_001801 [Trametes sanguinea]
MLLVEALRDLAEKWGYSQDLAHSPELFSDFVHWTTENRTSAALAAAVAKYRTTRDLNRKIHRYVVARLGLDRTHGRAVAESLPRHYLHRLSTPYPPLNEYVAETDRIQDLWSDHFANRPRPDKRRARQAVHLLNPAQLALTIGPEDSCVLVDADDDSIIAVVMRCAAGENTSESAPFLDWANATIKSGMEDRRSVRKEDPGAMVQTGYTAGSRSAPLFAWVRNLEHKKRLTPERVASSDYASSCLLAVGWNIIRSAFPPVITSDWIDFLCANGLPAMDAGVGSASHSGDYSIQYGDDTITFHDAELAPPTGILNHNYSRAIHFERQPHSYAVQWIISRSHGSEYGGHFYLSSYGVQIINTADTMIAWRPTDMHGTSLALFNPDPKKPTLPPSDPPFEQRGTTYATSNRLASVYGRYGDSLRAALDGDAGNIPFSKRQTAEDAAAAAAAQEFINQISAGVLFEEEGEEGKGV